MQTQMQALSDKPMTMDEKTDLKNKIGFLTQDQ
jgi:hypothetical protein